MKNIWFFTSLLIILSASSCHNEQNKLQDANNSNDLINSLLIDLSANNLNENAIINKYYSKPELIFEDTITLNRYILDIKMLKWMVDEFGIDNLKCSQGEDILNTQYGLYHFSNTKNNFCDDCGVIYLKSDENQRFLFCFKDGLIFSTTPQVDLVSFEVIWY